MLIEHSGKTEINITHDLSNIENLRKVNRINFCTGELYLSAIVEIRGASHNGEAGI